MHRCRRLNVLCFLSFRLARNAFFCAILWALCVSQNAFASGAINQQQQAQQIAQQQAAQQVLEQQMAQEFAQRQAQGQPAVGQQSQAKRRYRKTRVLKEEVRDLKAHEIVDIYELWERLEVSSEVWQLIMDYTPKEITVSRYIRLYSEGGIYLRKSSGHYVKLIDSMAKESPDLLKSPFREVMRFIAILEYDFDNGQDKDRLAQQALGNKLYRDNRIRLGIE